MDKIRLAALETLLVIKFRPTFLTLTYHSEIDIIEVVISCNSFNYLSLNERIITVFNEIYKELPNLVEEHLIVIQAFNSIEMDAVLTDLFEGV